MAVYITGLTAGENVEPGVDQDVGNEMGIGLSPEGFMHLEGPGLEL